MDKNKMVEGFLRSRGLDTDSIDRDGILSEFDSEMTKGLEGKPSSLAMIPSFISVDHEVQTGKPVVVLDAGGTNLRTAVVRASENGEIEIGDFSKRSMPGAEYEMGRDEFFEAFADFVEPNLGHSDTIGFCFSYAAEITPDCDARLLYWSKQIAVPSVVNTMIGAGLREHLKARGFDRRIVILNDTVAALLAGRSRGLTSNYSAYVGFILGTGTNTAYVEHNSKITKRSDLNPQGSMAVNVESGGFRNIEQSLFDRLLDQRTNDPGAYTFEKMISGRYLGSVGSIVLLEAAKEGFFSTGATESIMAMDGGSEDELQLVSNKDMDDFCGGKFCEGNPLNAGVFNDDDKKLIRSLCTPVYERAAILAAINIAAAVIKTGAGSDPARPVCVNVDGSTYYRTITADFENRVRSELDALLSKRALNYELVKVDDSPVIGAAVAGLMK